MYGTPDGHEVALDNAPGPYLIVGTKAYRSNGSGGFRGHWEHPMNREMPPTRIELVHAV
jgi:hypothetical protein